MKQTIIVITTHVIVQLLIYGTLSYFHLLLFLITRVIRTPPNTLEMVCMHSASVIANLVIAGLFSVFWRHTWRLNMVCVIVNLMFIIIYSVVIWHMYYS